MPWDPKQYLKFEAQRFAPFDDLFAMIDVRPGLHVVDLGCGTGTLTARLQQQLPDSDVVGFDSSPEMLEHAMTLDRPGLRFEQRSIEDAGGRWDLVFSHAALQWVDDHPVLIPRAFSFVAPGGQLAVQIPSNHGHASHVLIRETAAEDPFRTALDGWTRVSPVLSIDEYAGILFALGATGITVIEKVYPHVLEHAGAVLDWVHGTALVPYLERLPAHLREQFVRCYREKLLTEWPGSPVFYPFRRTLFVASRPA